MKKQFEYEFSTHRGVIAQIAPDIKSARKVLEKQFPRKDLKFLKREPSTHWESNEPAHKRVK